MKITCLGSGNAFSEDNFNQSYMLEEGGRRMLIDYGRTAPEALKSAGLTAADVDDIYISHAHNDHIGGLEHMALQRYDWVNKPHKWDDYKYDSSSRSYINDEGSYKGYAPRLICNVELMKILWENSLSGGLQYTMEGFVAGLDTFFQPVAIEPNTTFKWQGWSFELIQQIHVMAGNVISHTYGVIISKPGRKSVYFTTDSQHCSPKQVSTFYNRADLIFQDCELTGVNAPEQKMVFTSGVHANYAELAGWPDANNVVLPAETKAKMFLSHYQDFKKKGKDFFGNPVDWNALSEQDGFGGWAEVGQTWEV